MPCACSGFGDGDVFAAVEEAEAEVGSDMWDALRTSSPVELREAATRVRPKMVKEQLNEQ